MTEQAIDQPESTAEQWGRLIEFPTQRDGDGQVGDDAGAVVEHEEPSDQAEVVPARRVGQVPPALISAGRTAAPHVKTGGQFVARHGVYLIGGAWDTASAVYARWSGRDIDERIAAAQAAGEHGVVAELGKQKLESKKLLIDRLKAFGKFLKYTPHGLLGVCGTPVLITAIVSVVAFFRPGGLGFAEVWTGIADALIAGWDWVTWLGTTVLPLSVVAVAAGLLVSGYHKRRRSGAAPEWAQSPVVKPGEVVNLTPSIVVKALRDLGIAPLRTAIKDDPDAGAWMLGPITRYGPGAQVQVKLPPQVNTEKIRANRNTLAGNLDRKSHEVLIECSEDSEREFELWVADSGALDQSVPASPLLNPDYGQVDIYRDLMPWGVSPKGEALELFLHQQHLLLAGLSKQGKTACARSIVLWLSLDPSVRLLISDLKGFGDWSMFDGLAETLIEGSSDTKYIETADMLDFAMREYERRMAAWKEMGGKGDIGREDSKPGSGFEPLVIVIDEAQKLYTCSTEHPDGGEIGGNGKKARAARTAQAIHDQARAANIWLVQFAQNPTNANLPAIVREGAFIRASLFVGTESVAKMSLGESAVDTGAAPHALRQGKDRGTVVLAPGESMDLPGGASHTTVRTHYISTKDAYDVAERAKALRSGPVAAIETESRDLLADVSDVLGEQDKVRATDVCARLRKLASTYRPYRDLGAEGLKSELEQHGVRVTKAGVLMVRADRVRLALSAREEDDEGAEEE